MPTSTPKPVASGAHAAAGKGAQAGAADAASGPEGFDRQFNQAMRQQVSAALPAAIAPPVLPAKVALASVEAGGPLAGKDETTTDPAERDGNALAAAVLAMLGQGVAAQAKIAAGSQGQTVSADAGKGGAQRGLPGLVTDAAKDAGAAAPAPSIGIDASALVAAASASPAPETHKSAEPGNIEALAASMTPHAPAPNAAPVAHSLKMDTPAGNPGFAQELGQQVAWLGGQEIKQARIRLRPEELGQLDVKVSVAEHGRVDVSFTAQHPAAVTAVQQTLGQLDLMLAGHGLSLGQAQVGQQGAGERGTGSSGDPQDALVADADPVESVSARTVAVGLLDTFA
ncbi:flagellar hook-length control protein FliK [Dyella sp. LX-1]|nr:flagellar hook-length control protein FliK [Dyella sp. LX-1]MBT2115986.1 flagellar hook-length control protein FliK [Dyella sp. LX-1]